jgi:hypothetical protein
MFVLKPNCSSTHILFLIKCWYIRTNKISFETLEIGGQNRYRSAIIHIIPLSIFNIVLITASFNVIGNVPEYNILLHIRRSGEVIYGELIFRRIIDFSL